MAENQPAKFDAIQLDAVLAALLEHDPPPHVAAIDEQGFFVPLPPSVQIGEGRLIEGRMSAVQLVISADMQKTIEAWEYALQNGAASEQVHLLSSPAEPVSLHFVDARHSHGVMLGIVVGARTLHDAAEHAQTVIRPRIWTAKKNQLAVITEVDPAVTEILGWTPEEMLGRRSLEFIHPEDQPRAIANWLDMLATRADGHRARLRHCHRDGSWVWFEYTNYNLLNDPAHGCVRSEMINISDEMAALEALRAREELLRLLAEALPLGIVQIDAAGRVIYRNGRVGAIVGNELAGTIEEQLAGVVPADREALAHALHAVVHEGRDGEVEVILSRDGETRCCSLSLRALQSEKGALTGALICIDDVTERALLREELEYRATYDALTGCRNRASILAVLERAIRQEKAAPDSGTAVLFVDLDQFKKVNDRWGHAVGDEVLRRTSRRLIEGARCGDIVGRFGGDEFLVVCPGVAGAEQAAAIAERIAARLGEAIEIGSIRTEQRASIGVAWIDGGMDSEALIAAADAAMYDSKREALGRPVLIHPIPRSCVA
ncbi:MAG: diguanylate cyclase [Candidatus Baltobacteraceae bacterium]|jgi:diguanylate cyclase (GGDEF)-like protein/PAS domain S-box-containing protein